MNKELFVSSTPHETKVGLVEDDLLAEIYLERENEYTLPGSIYKDRVTRVLPGMQSAFVDVGLERDAFLYVSDFMELEEHDEDVTDIVPANRGIQDMRPQPARGESEPGELQSSGDSHANEPQARFESASSHNSGGTQEQAQSQTSEAAQAGTDASSGGSSPDRERGGYRGRRRRRGGRRDERGDGRDRGSETRSTRPSTEAAVPPPPAPRPQESGRTQQFGPPAGYQPILLPGESISKYKGLSHSSAVPERHSADRSGVANARPDSSPVEPAAGRFQGAEPVFWGGAPQGGGLSGRDRESHYSVQER